MIVKDRRGRTYEKFKIDKWAIIITLVIVLALSIYIVLLPEQATATLNNLRVFTTSKMGFYFVLITIGIFAVNISLAFSKYGNIKLGKGDPNYKTFSWIAMIFVPPWEPVSCTGLHWNGFITIQGRRWGWPRRV